MTRETDSVGARKIVEALLGEGQAVRWSRPVLRYWGFLFVGFVLLFVWLPSQGTLAEPQVSLWIATYTGYLLILEFLGKTAKRWYESTRFRLFRVHFNLIMIAALILVGPPTASGYLWFFFSLPILAMILYFGHPVPVVVIYLEVCAAVSGVMLVQDLSAPIDFATLLAQDAILGLLASVLYFFVYFFPRLREENTLLEAATTLMNVLDRRELCQLLADAARAGIPTSDAAVIHLLEGEDRRTLAPSGSSNIDLTTLGRTPMKIGVGIAGHAIQNREPINVSDVSEDDRYLQLHPSFAPFKSLLVAPMYVGRKNVGTISVQSSARKAAFSKRDERFLTALAAQGATAIANAELYDTRTRRRQQISDILEASAAFGLHQQLDTLLKTIAAEVCRCSGYKMAVVNLLDETGNEIIVKAMNGVPPVGIRKLKGLRIPYDTVMPLLRDEFRISRSYFIRYDRRPDIPDLDQYTFTADLGERKPGEWHQEDMLIVPIQTQEKKLLGYISVDDPSDRQLPSFDTIQTLEVLARVAATAIENARLYEQAKKEIAERKRVEELLAREQHLWQTFMDNAPDNIYFKDTESRFIRINEALTDRLGLDDPAQAIGKTDFDFFTDEHAQQAYEDEQKIIRTGRPLSVEEKETWPDGRETWVATTKMPLRDEEGRIIGTFGISKDITERKRVQDALQQRSRELALLNDIGGKIAAVLDLNSVLDRAAHLVQEDFGYHHVGLFTLDRERNDLVMKAKAGSFVSLYPTDHCLKLGQGMVGWTGQHGEKLLANDVNAEPRYINLYPDLVPTRSELCVPIRVSEEVVGVLDVQSPQLDAFDENDVMVLEMVADQVAVAIDNARLYEAVQQELTERKQAEDALLRSNRKLALLHRAGQAISSTLDLDQVLITVLEEVRHLLDVVACSVWLTDPATDELVCRQSTDPKSDIVRGWHLAPGQGIAGWVARTGETLIVPDVQADERHFKGVDEQARLGVRSLLTVPLRVKQGVIGVLQVVDAEVNRFKPTDLTLVGPLAATAAIAIENARLYKETDRLRVFNENIVQSMEEGILIEDADGQITFANRKTTELLRYSPTELIGQHWKTIVSSEVVAKVEEEAAKRPKGIASRYETVLLTREGQPVPVMVSATPFFDEGLFTGTLCVYTDITDRKRQETRLRDYLSTVTSSLAQHTRLEGLYKFIVEAGTRFLSARDCSLFLTNDGDGNSMGLVAATETAPRADTSDITTGSRSEGGLVTCVVEWCQPVRLLGKEMVQHPLWNEKLWTKLGWNFDPERDHSLLAAPMCLHDGQVVGVLAARRAESDEGFSKFDEELLKTLATNAAADIERVRSVEKAREDAIRTERRRLEVDVHEAMNVLATGVRWEAEILADELTRNNLPEAHIALERLLAALPRAYTDLRYLLMDLRDPILEKEGLFAALRSRAQLIGHRQILVHEVSDEEVLKNLGPEIEGVLYRVGKEAMSNAVKHSGAADDSSVKIEVQLEVSDKQVRLCVKDNGIGFDVESTLGLSHKWGLRRLDDLVREAGDLKIDSAPGMGTSICAAIDLAEESRGSGQ